MFQAILATKIKVIDLVLAVAFIIFLLALNRSLDPVVSREHVVDAIDNISKLSRVDKLVARAINLASIGLIKLIEMFLRESEQRCARVWCYCAVFILAIAGGYTIHEDIIEFEGPEPLVDDWMPNEFILVELLVVPATHHDF